MRTPELHYLRKAKAFEYIKNKAKAKGDRETAAFFAGEQRRSKRDAKNEKKRSLHFL